MRSPWRFIGSRLFQAAVTYFLFLTLIFFLLELQPGDFSAALFGQTRLSAQQLQTIRMQMGIDRTPAEQYVRWMGGFLRGDLGVALSESSRPVAAVLAERLPRTAVLFLSATLLSFAVGFWAGKRLAWRRGTRFETVVTVGGVALYTVFTPWFALWMLWIFAYLLGIFPVGKFITYEIWGPAAPAAGTVFLEILLAGGAFLLLGFGVRRISARFPSGKRGWVQAAGFLVLAGVCAGYWGLTGQAVYVLDILRHLALPVLTLTLISFGGTMLLTRNSMLSVLGEDYIVTARAKGLTDGEIRDRHAARNALLPVLTTLMFALAFAVDGGVVTEAVFSWEGMGYTLIHAVEQSDVPLAVGALVVTGGLVLLAHLAADILYFVLDPRLRQA
jgi:peptide/nickel transport system permease protein